MGRPGSSHGVRLYARRRRETDRHLLGAIRRITPGSICIVERAADWRSEEGRTVETKQAGSEILLSARSRRKEFRRSRRHPWRDSGGSSATNTCRGVTPGWLPLECPAVSSRVALLRKEPPGTGSASSAVRLSLLSYEMNSRLSIRVFGHFFRPDPPPREAARVRCAGAAGEVAPLSRTSHAG